MSERELQDAVVELATLLGWHVQHTRPAMTSQGYRTPIQGHVGYPDLTLVRGGRLLFAELKSAGGKVRPEQAVWLAELKACPVEVFTWRPEDWRTGEIERVLRG